MMEHDARATPPGRSAVRIVENHAGRDFVVGDVHGEFPTLEALLDAVDFEPGRDRLFALGDLVSRGPRSRDALHWMRDGRITLSVRGNHEQMLEEQIARVLNNADAPWVTHAWFEHEVAPDEWPRWRAMVRAMPIAATIATRAGAVGLIHAGPPDRDWSETLEKLARNDRDTCNAALWTTARAFGNAEAARHEGVPLDGPIAGVRAVMTGHVIVTEPRTSANVWHIDTGAGSAKGRLTIARIDCAPIETTTMAVRR